MSSIYLDSKYNEFSVDDDTFAQVAALVRAGKQCTYEYRERHAYSLDNPCVGKSICLHHTLTKHAYLTVLDSPKANSDGQHIYRFLDRHGYVYTTTEDTSEEPSKNVSETLAYYGFIPPVTVASRGKSVDFHTYYATLYGDLRNASVMVLSYSHSGEKVKGLFLLYKNGLTKELSKRSDVYHHADELVEASRDTHGQYHINGHSHFSKSDADVYEVISQLESATYDVALKLQNGIRKEEDTND